MHCGPGDGHRGTILTLSQNNQLNKKECVYLCIGVNRQGWTHSKKIQTSIENAKIQNATCVKLQNVHGTKHND